MKQEEWLLTAEKDDWLDELLRWTESNLSRHITLQEASQQSHFARDYFCHRFKELTNTSYIRYVNQRRMERASELLQAGATVETAARNCGITCIPYFVQLFKRQYKVTPTRYRADAAQKQGETENEEKTACNFLDRHSSHSACGDPVGYRTCQLQSDCTDF